jgi:hypothetical protein
MYRCTEVKAEVSSAPPAVRTYTLNFRGVRMNQRMRTYLNSITPLLIAMTTASAHAASSGTLTLSGTVAAKNDVTIAPNGTNNTTLNILTGETGKNVATVTETSNDLNGYKIQMYSANGGQLQLAGQSSVQTAYQVSYAGASYVTPPLAASPVTVKNVSSLNGLTSTPSAITVNVTAYPTALAGTYSDTVTFAIVGN